MLHIRELGEERTHTKIQNIYISALLLQIIVEKALGMSFFTREFWEF